MQEYNTTLSQDHLKMHIEGSGIALDVASERGYCTSTGYSELKSLRIPLAHDTDTHGLLLPLYTTAGQRAHLFIAKEDRTVPLMIYRPEAPQVGRDGRQRKYLYPGGERMRLDCHPRACPLMGDPTVPLWITEGIKKGDALVSHRLCVLALLGVWCWRGTNEHGGTVVLPDWQHVALNGREVRLVFDSDVMEKPDVAAALHTLTQWLTSKNARVHVAYLPSAEGEKVGVDDYLLTHTVSDLEHLLEAPRQPRRGSTAAIQALPALELDKKGEPRPVVSNILEILTKDSRWGGVFGYDAFAQCATLLRQPPYLLDTAPWTMRPVEDHDDTETSNWLQREYHLYAATSLVTETIQMLAHRAPFRPIQRYLEGLQWDGTARLARWLTTYCQVEDTPYARAVGTKTLLSAVARVSAPGCKADCVTILQGEQGLFKSTVWRILAGDAWFSDTMPDITRKDAMEGLHGKWLVELGELAALHRSEKEALKRFLSSLTDHYRPSYGRRAVTFPRQVLFVATTNKEVYFQDETGSRRWWPVKVTGPCKIADLQRDRDQLWAEAVARYQQGAIWYLTREEEALAEVEQEERFEVDPWEESVLEYVTGKDKVTTKAIMVEQFQWENPALWTQANSKRLGAILRRHGWRHAPYREEGKLIKGYQRVVTDPTGNTPPTGNTLSGSKNNAVTSVTDVTSSSRNPIEKIVNQEKNTYTGISIALYEGGGNTGNAGNTGNSPHGPPASAVAGLAALNGGAPDCLLPPCPHPETQTQRIPEDGSSLVRCTTCHRIVRVIAPERRS